MSRIAERFARLAARGGKALVPYIMAGDPSLDDTVPLMRALTEAGADVIELGVPFTDPMADGPVIQAASERALEAGASLARVLDVVRAFRQRDDATPVVLMGYANPVEVMGVARFAEAAAGAGVDGVLTVDLPPEEATELRAALCARALDPVFLLSPTTTPERIEYIASVARGFLYYVSLKGVTGSECLDTAAVEARVAAIRRVTKLPIGVGFGIRDAAAAAQIARVADAVVVGSALVRVVADCGGERARLASAVRDFATDLRRAIDAA